MSIYAAVLPVALVYTGNYTIFQVAFGALLGCYTGILRVLFYYFMLKTPFNLHSSNSNCWALFCGTPLLDYNQLQP